MSSHVLSRADTPAPAEAQGPARGATAVPRIRSSVDAVRAGAGALLVVGGMLFANTFDSTLLGLATDTATNMDQLPVWADELAGSVAASIVISATLAIAVWSLLRTRYRRFLLYTSAIVASATASIVLGRLLYGMVEPQVQAAFALDDIPLFRVTGADGRLNPADPLLAAAVATLTIASSFLPVRITRRAMVVVVAYATASALTVAAPPLAVITDVGVGILVGSILLWVVGRHDLALRAPEIRVALESAGLEVTDLRERPGREPRHWVATLADGDEIVVIARSRDDRSSALATRAFRWVRLRKTGDHRPFLTLRRSVEHEALVRLQATHRGIPTPAVRAVAVAGVDGMILARNPIDADPERRDPARYSERDLRAIWRITKALQEARIAHGRLRLDHFVIDRRGDPQLVDFERGELAATEQRLGTDLAELLASSAAEIGEAEAVRIAHDEIGSAMLARSIPWLQPLALSTSTRRLVATVVDFDELRTLVGEACGRVAEEPVSLERIDPKTVFVLGTLVLSAWFLVPQLTDLDSLWSQARDASTGWAGVAIAFSIGTYLAATGSLLGAIPVRLAYWPALTAQLASSFANRVTPAKVGGMATNLRYFQCKGVPPAVGATAVGLNAVAGVIMHVTLTVCALLIVSGDEQAGGLEIPALGTVLLVAGAVAATVVAGLAVPATRRLIVAHVVPQLRTGADAMRVVARDPLRLMMLFGGAAVITLCYLGAMFASMRAFGSSASLPIVALVFLSGSAVANAAPTPGGLGAAEAALIAALSTIEEAAIVVPAVFLYRLVTFWLPIVPGWIALTMLRRRDAL